MNATNERKHLASSHIGKKIIFFTIVLSGFITLVATLLQMFWEYHNQLNEVEVRHKEVETVHVPLFASSLWDYNDDRVHQRLASLTRLPNISYLELRSEGLVYRSGTPVSEFKVESTYHIYYYPEQMEAEYLGEIFVQSSTKRIYIDLAYYFLITLMSNGIKTLIVCFAILLLVHKAISLRVFAISDYLKKFDPVKSPIPLKLPYQNTFMTKGDEIEGLGDQVIDMAGNLSQIYANLQSEYNRFSDFADVSSDWLWEVNTKGELIYASDQVLDGLSINRLPICIDDNEILAQAVNLLDKLKGQTPFVLSEEKLMIHGETRYLMFQATPIFYQREFSGFRGTALDITDLVATQLSLNQLNQSLEQKVSERTEELNASLQKLQQTQKKLVESEKLSALGRLVAGVAHEVNTPLGVSITASSVIEDLVEELKQCYKKKKITHQQFAYFFEDLDSAIKLLSINLNRGKKLIDAFKQTATDQTSELCNAFNIEQKLSALIASFHAESSKWQLKLQLRGDESLEMVSFPGAFVQTFSNLIMNSLMHAFQDQPAPEITIDYRQEQESIIFTYQDNGCGVPQEVQQDIFEPFYTSSRSDGATGLGLTTVHNLVTHNLEGEFFFESELGQGVRFVITLPRLIEHASL